MITHLSANQVRLFALLKEKIGQIVTYDEIDPIISCRLSKTNLASSVHRLRKCGARIRCVSGRGYVLKPAKVKSPVHIRQINANCEAQAYAADIQDAIHDAMHNHAKTVGFETQMAIMGVVIGGILVQLTDDDRRHFTKILVKNLSDAKQFIKPMSIQ